jgi:hypothetical protein
MSGRMQARVDGKAILLYVIKTLAATAAGYAVARFLYEAVIVSWDGFFQLLFGLPAAVAVTLLVVLAVGYSLNISDLRSLPAALRRKK